MPRRVRLLPLLLTLFSAVAFAGAGAPPAAAATGIQIATDGDDPGIAVDAAGTAHIAFQSQTGAAFPFTHDYSYCRLPRGATSCNKRVRLKTGGAPDGTLSTSGRAQVLVDGRRVIVVGNTCCGTGEGVKAWVSTDAGNTFAPPVTLFKEIAVREAVLGPGENAVSAIDSTTTGGVKYATGSLDGTTASVQPFVIGAGVGPDPFGALAQAGVGLLNAATPYTVLSDSERVWVKRFDSTKNGFNMAANWLAPQKFDEENITEPVTTYGPNGVFVAYATNNPRPELTYPFIVHRIGDDGSIGPAMELGGDVSAFQGDIAQDAGGRVHVAYKDNRHANQLTYQWSKRGVTWADPVTLSLPDENLSGVQIGVGPDGGGWIVAGSSNNLEPIKVYPLEPKGDADPAPAPGPQPPGTPPVEPPLACPAQIEVAKGIKAQVRTADCFKDLGKGKFRTTGSVRVNGVDFTAPASGTFTVDTKAHTVEAKGSYSTKVGSIVLREGSLIWNVTQINQVPGLSAFGVKLFGLGISGTADVKFDAVGAAVTVNVDLPYPLDAIRGQTTLRTTMSTGLIVDGVHITATTIPIGPVEIRNLDLLYTGANDGFEGKADLYLPPSADKAVSAAFGFAGGTFKHAEFEIGAPAPPFPLPLWAAPPVVLNRVGLAAVSDDKGFTLKGGVEIVAGKEIAGLKPVSINALPSGGGGASLFIPKKGDYAVIAAKGKIAILDIPVATGQLSLSTAGPLTFGGSANIDFEIVDINVLIEGGINLSNAEFYAGGKGSACVSLLNLEGCAHVSAILSSIGFAVCGSLEGKEKISGASVSIGLGYDRKWKGSGQLGDCKYDEYKPASLTGSGARARRLAADGEAALLQAGGAQTLVLPGGPQRGVRVKGAGARPGFTFAGPNGRTLTVAAGTSEPSFGGPVAALPVGPDEVELQVKQPAGSWTLTPAAGSTVTSVTTAEALPTPKLSGSVGKAGGRARTLRVKAGNLGDQTLIVREVLAGGGARELGKVKRSGTSTLRFTPTDGPAGKRTIEAVVVAGDRQVGVVPITTYTAPGPQKLPAPRSVTLKRSKTAVAVKWSKVSSADRYRVKIVATDGREQILTVDSPKTKVSVPAVTADDKVTIRVSAVTKLGVEGKSRAATSKATKKTKKAKKKR